MAIRIPDFDPSGYDPHDAWNFPPQRLVHFAAQAYVLFEEGRNQTKLRHHYPDMRFVIWHMLCGHAHALLLGAMHLRSHGDALSWWEVQPEFDHAIDKRMVSSNNGQLRQLLQLGFVQQVVRQLDMGMRQVAATLEHEEPQPTKRPLSAVWRDVLTSTSLKRYGPLLPLLLAYRDALSQNDRFCPVDGQDMELYYLGRRFSFKAGQEMDVIGLGFMDQWDYLLHLLHGVRDMLGHLFQSPPLLNLPFIQVPYLD